MSTPGWIDAAYMSCAFPGYFPQQPQNAQFVVPTMQAQPTILSTHSAASIIPSQPGTPLRSGSFIPTQFHPLAHPFMPFDLASLHNASMNVRQTHHIQHNASLSPESTIMSSQTSEHLNTSRLTAGSPRPSSSGSISNGSDESDDEQIDVVESDFTEQINASIPKARCELKAPSAMKPVHETAPTLETKIKSPISAQKAVWRPY